MKNKNKNLELLFDLVPPILLGLVLGFASADVYRNKSLIIYIIWLVISIIAIILNAIRLAYYKHK